MLQWMVLHYEYYGNTNWHQWVFKKGYKVEKVWIWEELKREEESKYDQNTLYIYIYRTVSKN